MPGTANTPNRETIGNISLPPDMAARLKSEIEERDISASKAVEKAIALLFAKWDTPDAPAKTTHGTTGVSGGGGGPSTPSS